MLIGYGILFQNNFNIVCSVLLHYLIMSRELVSVPVLVSSAIIHILLVICILSSPCTTLCDSVDVFHAPRKFDPKAGKKTAKESVVAMIVSIVHDHKARPNLRVIMYCKMEV